MNRLIKIFGNGSTEVENPEVVIKLDGSEVFSGVISSEPDTEIASWTEGKEQVTRKLEITAVSGKVSYVNAMSTFLGEGSLSDPELDNAIYITEDDGDVVSDTNDNVLMDGEPFDTGEPDDRSKLFGQWTIKIPEGSTMTCDFTVGDAPIRFWNPETSYIEGNVVQFYSEESDSTDYYRALQPVPANTEPTNSTYWDRIVE